MISSSNDSTSTMALTTLLKISTEEAIGNLLAVALSHVFCIKDDSMVRYPSNNRMVSRYGKCFRRWRLLELYAQQA